MRFFEFLKNWTQASRAPEAILHSVLDNLPENYKTQRQFIDAVEFLQHREWGLALESVIELADETGDDFADDFWLDLAEAADKMNMIQESAYCRKQPGRARHARSQTTAAGTMVEKAGTLPDSEDLFRKISDKRAEERRRTDDVPGLMAEDGIHMPSGMRSGTIYYVRDKRLCEIYWEVSGVPQFDILVDFNSVEGWTLPTPQAMTDVETRLLKDELLGWLKARNIRADLY